MRLELEASAVTRRQPMHPGNIAEMGFYFSLCMNAILLSFLSILVYQPVKAQAA